ncbi:MAG TPA: phosphoribosyltransferase family protein [Thermoplasmata archaeon]|nr:phosphoribosyltransferase family protein [Thermoplasmata archaeon]
MNPPERAAEPRRAQLAGPLRDRAEAGRFLADELGRLELHDPIVLGIPRGGVPVGYEIARRLRAPLDVLVVRKIGAPGDPEYGLGAVAEGDLVLLDEPRARAAGFSRAALEPVIRQELEEVTDRLTRFREGRPPPELAHRSVVVVDDGVATGGTVEAGIAVVRARGPAAVVVALGVAPAGAVGRLRAAADAVVVLLTPSRFEAVGEWYRRFDPVDDREVARLLAEARAFPRARAA